MCVNMKYIACHPTRIRCLAFNLSWLSYAKRCTNRQLWWLCQSPTFNVQLAKGCKDTKHPWNIQLQSKGQSHHSWLHSNIWPHIESVLSSWARAHGQISTPRMSYLYKSFLRPGLWRWSLNSLNAHIGMDGLQTLCRTSFKYSSNQNEQHNQYQYTWENEEKHKLVNEAMHGLIEIYAQL